MDLNPLGRKGYSVPKVGTIQVVSEGVLGALRELMWEKRRISQSVGSTNLDCPVPRPYLTPTRLW